LFFRGGARIGVEVFRVERNVFIVVITRAALREHRIERNGRTWRVDIPRASPPILYLTVEGAQDDGVDELCIVLVRMPSLKDRIRSIWRRAPPQVTEAVAPGEVS
jgi:hypothetical protein